MKISECCGKTPVIYKSGITVKIFCQRCKDSIESVTTEEKTIELIIEKWNKTRYNEYNEYNAIGADINEKNIRYHQTC